MAFNVREIFKALADSKADYVLVGGLAVILHGHLRATRDIDLVVGLEAVNCRAALDALSGIGLRPRLPVTLADFADEATRTEWVEQRNMKVIQLWDPGNPERAVDLFVREPFPMAELLAESLTKDLDGVPIRIASIRHLIAMKEAAGRRHDLDDIEALRQIAAETGQPDGGDP